MPGSFDKSTNTQSTRLPDRDSLNIPDVASGVDNGSSSILAKSAPNPSPAVEPCLRNSSSRCRGESGRSQKRFPNSADFIGWLGTGSRLMRVLSCALCVSLNPVLRQVEGGGHAVTKNCQESSRPGIRAITTPYARRVFTGSGLSQYSPRCRHWGWRQISAFER